MVFESGPVRRGALLMMVVLIGASVSPIAADDDPIFVRWLVPDDPGDETIREYWEKSVNDELAAPGLVDLGTMLFYRGWPKDALKMYRRALKLDPEFYEAWFQIGLVEHSRGELDNARQAYRRCLKIMVGHGWCNFYLGLLEEQLGHSSNALYYYEQAFALAPELSDPKVNPEVLNSRLVLGARLRTFDHRSFEDSLPIDYMEPEKVREIYLKYEPIPLLPPPTIWNEDEPWTGGSEATDGVSVAAPTLAPTPAPAPVPPPRSIPSRRAPTTPVTPYGTAQPPTQKEIVPQAAPQVGTVSDEASLVPSGLLSRWLVEAFV